MECLKQEIKQCNICTYHLPHAPKPVFQIHPDSKIVLIGQAPGKKVQESGVAFSDKSGKILRSWLGVSREQFYQEALFSILPIGFCFPGKAKTGDLPPRQECAPKWHARILEGMQSIRLIILIGKYAQDYYLGNLKKKNLTETVRAFEGYLPRYFPIVHPSPLNFRWLVKNPWFQTEVIPNLQKHIKSIVDESHH